MTPTTKPLDPVLERWLVEILDKVLEERARKRGVTVAEPPKETSEESSQVSSAPINRGTSR